ncbi:thioredoxin family protein [Agromyces sp. ZXT2-3]|uniref:thioredoxin family protein n=1 Tax=Agromyces sp. ZXT2-3 TaxID=3461152 RepID=UPI004054EA60
MPAPTVRTTGAAALLVAALALTGCAATGTAGESDAPAPGSAASTPESTPDAAATPEASADAEQADADAAEAPAEGAYLDYTDGAIEATAGPKALFFHASWCPKCRALDEDLKAQGAPDGLTVFKVDYDSRTDLRQQYGVTIQTTIVFVDDAGEEISSVVLYEDPSVESLVAAMP